MKQMDNKEAIKLLKNMHWSITNKMNGEVPSSLALNMAIKALEQPEIIRCKDCKYANMTTDGECKYCDIWFPDEKVYMPGDYYCGSAERRGKADDEVGS